jgi:hypothetical protein
MLGKNIGTDCRSLARARRSRTTEDEDALSDLEALVLMLLVGEEVLELARLDSQDVGKPCGQ